MNQKNLSRRDFLKGSAASGALAVAAMLLGGGVEALAENDLTAVKWDEEADVVVAGSGGGLLAACDAADAGCEVILVEKAAFLGGECIMNEGWINGAGSQIQAAEGVTDNADTFAYDWAINHANCLAFENPEIVRVYHENSGAAIDRLLELGCEYKLAQDVQFFGSAPRAHIIQPNASAWSQVLKKAAEDRGVKIMMKTPMTALIINDAGEVIGIRSNDLRIKARKGVILATGDASANARMKGKYQPQYAEIGACAVNNTGDGLFAAMKLGADSSFTQNTAVGPCQMFYPTGSALNSYALGKGMIIVNKEGRRYANELDYSAVAAKQVEQTDKKAFAIFDSRVAAICHRPDCSVAEILPKFFAGEGTAIGLISGVGPAYLEEYLNAGTIIEADTLDSLAEKLGIDAEGLQQQAEEWSDTVKAGVDEAFGRPIMDDFQFGTMVGLEEGPFYGLVFRDPAWFCMDGPNLLVDTSMRILDTDGNPITRLFGAGAGLCGGTGTLYTNSCGDHMGFTAVSARIAAASVSRLESWA